MRSRIGQELRKLFTAELARRQPNFTRVERPKPGMDPKWVLKLAPDLSFFIKLHSLPRHDEFVLEVGWTDEGELGFRDNYKPSVDTKARKWGARLTQLWDNDGHSEQVWAVVPQLSAEEKSQRIKAINRGENISLLPADPAIEEVLPRVITLVGDAVDKFEQYAIPLFRRVAEERGIGWPGERESRS